ncbi:MAG TPA: electron transport complex subunit RsxA [Eubacterium sp.]|nr:electron transport complex subunit RsxA [Lachnospiraceae bacterium]HAZ91392.1 electron transport complex subunit RsxA [Eubacterium sp.]HBZ53576.1 electron transport complex subunit RsxA [Eubacterium sp.]
MSGIIFIMITAALINNVVLSQFLGLCPFLGVSKKSSSALGMGVAVTFVITISSLIASLIYKFLLMPLDLTYLNTIVFILVIAALVQFSELVIKKYSPKLYDALGVYLPLITTNCAVLGVVLLNVQNSYNILESVANGFATSVGFTLAICILAGIRERIDESEVPLPFRGMPIVMITAGLMSIAFIGFAGLR